MRVLPLLLAAGLLLAPLAAAQSGPSGSSSGESGEPRPQDPQEACRDARDEAAKRECAAAFCRSHPDARWCQANCPRPAAGCAPAEKPEDAKPDGKPQPDPQGCEGPSCPPCEPQRPAQPPAKGNKTAGDGGNSSANATAAGANATRERKPEPRGPPCRPEGVEGLKWIRFEVGADRASLLNYTVRGLRALDRLQLDGVGTLRVERRGSLLHATDGTTTLVLHDEPNGLVHFEAGDGGNATATLTFPAGTRIERGPEGDGARILYPDGGRGLLSSENLTRQSERSVTASGFFSFHLPARAAEAQDEGKRDARIEAAIERRHVGAEVVVKRPSGESPVEVLAYADVVATAQLPAGRATPDAPIQVLLSANLTSGRTVVLKVDPALLASADPARLVARYFDVHGANQTEVVFKPASSLEDILDPTDDGGQPEYYVVSDAAGLQVLVSVPRWSEHLVTLASLADVVQPTALAGLAAGLAATAVAAAALFRPRRRAD